MAESTIGVIGTGAMGRGIGQIMAAGGMNVLLFDATEGAAEAGRAFAERMILRAAEKGSVTMEDARAAAARMRVVDSMAGLAPCDAGSREENLGVEAQIARGGSREPLDQHARRRKG